jgi:TRAP-type transport system small permease protein
MDAPKGGGVAAGSHADSETEKNSVLEYVLAGLMACLLAVVFIQVVVRYVTYQPLAWTEEVARLLFIWVCMVGAVVGAKRGSHFAVTLIFDVLPDRMHGAVRSGLLAVEALFYGVFAWSAFLVTRVANNQRSPSLEFPMSLAYAALTVAGVLMSIFALRRLILNFQGKL